MTCRTALSAWILIATMITATAAADKQSVQIEKIGDLPSKNLHLAPSLVTADTCFVSDNGDITTRINGWVVGFELYKSLMDPAADCPDPYPFTVTAVNMPMIFDAPTPLVIASDVEAIDSMTVPGCTIPGLLLSYSSEYTVQIPEAGIWNLWVPLDTPVVVNGPFFAGFYIGNTFDSLVNPAVLTDDTPVTCATFNIWDETIGWIDLANNTLFNFPGRLAMEIAGVPGDPASGDPEPELLFPAEGDILLGNQLLWVWDRAITGRIDHAIFEYSNGGPFVEIGSDFDGTSSLRDGVNPVVSGNGFSLDWNFSTLPEGYYDLRATLVDSTGGTFATTVNVYLEPTPPVPSIVTPFDGTPFCVPTTIYFTNADENMSHIQVDYREAGIIYSSGVAAFNQAEVGDNNGITWDSNLVANGEFGDYYSAPVAAAMAVRLWSDRGYPALTTSGGNPMTTSELAEALASALDTRRTLGTYDEAMLSGLKRYVDTRGGGFTFDMMRNPGYRDLRRWVEDDQRTVMLGVGGDPGLWIAVDGFVAWQRPDGSYLVSVADPTSGIIKSAAWRDLDSQAEIDLFGYWQPVNIMLSMVAADWTVTRTLVGIDVTGSDGWAIDWNPAGMADGTYLYLHATGHDYDNHTGVDKVLVEKNCAQVFVMGDYDNDRVTDISDMVYLIAFITHGGPAPYGGAERADCNCDAVINIADVIYFMNYLFGGGSPPCR